MERDGRGRAARRSVLDFRLSSDLFSGSAGQPAGHLSRAARESPGGKGLWLRRDPSQQPCALHLQWGCTGWICLRDGGARFNGYLRSRSRLALRMRFAGLLFFPGVGEVVLHEPGLAIVVRTPTIWPYRLADSLQFSASTSAIAAPARTSQPFTA